MEFYFKMLDQLNKALGYRRKTPGTHIKVWGTIKRPQPLGIAVSQVYKKTERQNV